MTEEHPFGNEPVLVCPNCRSAMRKVGHPSPGTASFQVLPSGSSSSSDAGYIYSEMTQYVCTNPKCGKRLLIRH